MPHKLLITARQKTKIRSAFANNIFTDIKLSKTQFCKITESGKKALIDLAVPLAINILPKLATKAASSAIDDFDKKLCRREAVKTGKGFTLFISDEDMDDITKIMKLLEDSGLLIDGVNETVRHEIKKTRPISMVLPMAALLIALMASSLVQPVVSSLINVITRKRVLRPGVGQQSRFLPLLALPLLMKVLGKGVRRAGKGYDYMELFQIRFWKIEVMKLL